MSLSTQPFGPDNIHVSRIGLGCMGLAGTWNRNDVGPEHRKRAIESFTAALESGITFYDHADIYGDTACETVFKDCMAAVPGSRERIFIATKAGIRQGYYDLSPQYIRKSLLGSLDRLGISTVDLFQLHRPDPLTHPADTAAMLDSMVEEGLTRYVGVSNYYPHQLLALKKFLKSSIVSNQISISLTRLDPIYEGKAGGNGDGVLDQCMELGITPLAYTPLGKGYLSGYREIPQDYWDRERVERILGIMREIAPAYANASPGQLALAWLLKHPAGIIPLVGSNNPEHIREAVGASSIDLSHEDWYKLWVAARGERVP